MLGKLSSPVDYIPTFVIMSCVDVFAPLIAHLARLFVSRIRPHIETSANFNRFQLVCRRAHLTEMILLRILNDVYDTVLTMTDVFFFSTLLIADTADNHQSRSCTSPAARFVCSIWYARQLRRLCFICWYNLQVDRVGLLLLGWAKSVC